MSLGLLVFFGAIIVISRVFGEVAKGIKNAANLPPREPGSAPQTMTELLAEMRQQLEAAQRKEQVKRLPSNTTLPQPNYGRTRKPGTQSASTLPAKVPRRELPEVGAERGGSIEVASREVAAVEVDQDDDAEALVRRRIDAAASRNRAWEASDHVAFDQRIRESAPRETRAKPRSGLRQAMIWREVLGPPVSMRPPEE